MKLIIAGSRHLHPSEMEIDDLIILNNLYPIEIICGGATGVDYCGFEYAKFHNLKLTQFFPNWSLYGNSAGPRRNKQMAMYADALLLIWDGKSKGSKNMKDEMKKLNKPIYESIKTKDRE